MFVVRWLFFVGVCCWPLCVVDDGWSLLLVVAVCC